MLHSAGVLGTETVWVFRLIRVIVSDRTAVGLESGRQLSLDTQGGMSGLPSCEDADEACVKGGRPGRSVLSHVATEQRRRDKINEG